MKAILTKIKSNHNNVRTNVIEGKIYRLPKIGESLIFTANPLKEGEIRIIITTPVESIKQTDLVYNLETDNSEYILKIVLDKSTQA